MTELTFRSMIMSRPTGSVIGNWWHAIDKLVLGAVLALFAVGLVLGLAASPPLADKNGLWTYHAGTLRPIAARRPPLMNVHVVGFAVFALLLTLPACGTGEISNAKQERFFARAG